MMRSSSHYFLPDGSLFYIQVLIFLTSVIDRCADCVKPSLLLSSYSSLPDMRHRHQHHHHHHLHDHDDHDVRDHNSDADNDDHVVFVIATSASTSTSTQY